MLPGQLILLLLQIERCQSAMRSGMLRVEVYNMLESRHHGLWLTALGIGHSQNVVRFGIMWCAFRQGTELGDCSLDLPFLKIANA